MAHDLAEAILGADLHVMPGKGHYPSSTSMPRTSWGRWSPSPDALRLATALAVMVVLNAVLLVVWRQ